MEVLKDKRLWTAVVVVIVLLIIASYAGWFGGEEPQAEAPAQEQTTTP